MKVYITTKRDDPDGRGFGLLAGGVIPAIACEIPFDWAPNGYNGRTSRAVLTLEGVTVEEVRRTVWDYLPDNLKGEFGYIDFLRDIPDDRAKYVIEQRDPDTGVWYESAGQWFFKKEAEALLEEMREEHPEYEWRMSEWED